MIWYANPWIVWPAVLSLALATVIAISVAAALLVDGGDREASDLYSVEDA